MAQDDHYPSPREALFSNGHTANAWCAAKYVVWQGVHVCMAAVLAFFAVTIAITFAALDALFAVVERVDNVIGTGVKEAASKGAKKVADSASEKPVTRRLYNECPVSFDIEPKWFESAEDKCDELMGL